MGVKHQGRWLRWGFLGGTPRVRHRRHHPTVYAPSTTPRDNKADGKADTAQISRALALPLSRAVRAARTHRASPLEGLGGFSRPGEEQTAAASTAFGGHSRAGCGTGCGACPAGGLSSRPATRRAPVVGQRLWRIADGTRTHCFKPN